ncbi:hypothetical protein [Streptomyces sp. NRRL B-24572]|nr:hypothetical protein [Streptomyces sp. NRRL B-24572]
MLPPCQLRHERGLGRFAAIVDPQGAAFAVIDERTTVGDAPEFE